MWNAYDAELGWSKLATGGVEIRMLPGAHHDLLKKPSADVLAADLKARLDPDPNPWYNSRQKPIHCIIVVLIVAVACLGGQREEQEPTLMENLTVQGRLFALAGSVRSGRMDCLRQVIRGAIGKRTGG
jgi:hypothetical protein